LRNLVAMLVQQRLREDMVKLQPTAGAEQLVAELNARAPVTGMGSPGEHVHQRVKACPAAIADEVIRIESQVASVAPQLLDQPVKRAIQLLDERQVLI